MRHAFLAFTNPVEGREAEFNAWYDDVHLEEVVQYGTGMTGGRRFRSSALRGPGIARAPWSYLAWYDLEHPDLAEYHRQPWAVDGPALKPFEGIVADDHAAWIYAPCGKRIGRPADGGREASGGCVRLFVFSGRGMTELAASLPGFVAGRQYEAAAQQRGRQSPPPRHLAVYEVEAGDAAKAAVIASTGAAPGSGSDDHVVWLFEPLGHFLERTSR